MKAKYWAIIILAALAASASAVYYAQQPPVDVGPVAVHHKPLAITPQNYLKDWKSYQSDQFGFGLQYPNYMEVKTMDAGDHPYGVFEITTPNSTSTDSLGIEVAAVPDTDPQLAEMGDKPKGTTLEKNISIDGVAGTYFTEADQSGSTGEEVWVKTNGRFYILKGVEPVFTQILSTFKFTSSATFQTDTSGWKTYTNLEDGFEFKYPNNWAIINKSIISSDYDFHFLFPDSWQMAGDSLKDGINFRSAPNNPVFYIISIAASGTVNENVLKDIEHNGCSNLQGASESDHIINSSYNKAQYVLYCSSDSEHYEELIKIKDGLFLLFDYHDDFDENWSENKKIETLNSIISTFKFTK